MEIAVQLKILFESAHLTRDMLIPFLNWTCFGLVEDLFVSCRMC